MMTKFIRPLSGLIAALLVAGGIGLVARSGGPGTYRVTAYFEKAIGLFPNSDVDILGVPVGKVLSVNPTGTRVEVLMEISNEHEVPADAFAQIVPISVISDRYVQLAPPYVGGPKLEDGAVLDLDRTQIPAELDDVFKQLKKLLEAIEPGEEGDPGALGTLIVELNEALRNQEENLRGTIVNTSALTGALADAQNDLSGILINLEDFLGTLATRSSSITSLNTNFAIVVGTLAESRGDVEETLASLADMTGEVGRLVRDNRERLGDELRLAANVLKSVLRHRDSVEESLTWLPVVGLGLKNAHHGGEINATDVRDSQNDLSCGPLDQLPDGPVKDALEDLCTQQTGEPRGDTVAASSTGTAAPPQPREPSKLDCKQGVRKVRHQLKRLIEVDLPQDVLDELVKPLKKKLRKLARECKELGDALSGRGSLLDELDDGIGGIPDVDDTFEDLDELTGSAAGAAIAAPPSPGIFDSLRRSLRDFLGFLGWSS